MKGVQVMKTFIVYHLDTGLPVAVGEAMKAEWARVETAEETKIRAENLIAEEIDLGREFELL
jgi:hypothetical protein